MLVVSPNYRLMKIKMQMMGVLVAAAVVATIMKGIIKILTTKTMTAKVVMALLLMVAKKIE